MAIPRAVIDLSPARLTVAVVSRARTIRSASVDLDPALWAPAWEAGLEALDAPLREAVAKAGVAVGSPVALLHAGPSAQADVRSFPTPPRAALRAAALMGAEARDDDAGPRVSLVRLLGRDAGGAPRQTHVLAAWDSPLLADAASAWLVRCGLTPVALVPGEAPLLAAAVREAITGDASARLALLLGEHASALAGAEGGALKFVRSVAFGVQTLADALTRPIRSRDFDGPSITLTRAEAESLLRTFGVPAREQTLDEASGLRGADVLPLLQPALQRCAIEIKQTLRFGLSDGARPGLRLHVLGPGAAIPHLAMLLAEQSEVALSADGVAGAGGVPALDLIDRYLRLRSLVPAVNGPSTLSSINARRARSALRIGAAAGVVLLALDGAAALTELRATRAEISALESSPALKAAAGAEERAAMGAALARAEHEIATHHANLANFPAWLAEASRRTPLGVRLHAMNAKYEGGKPIVEIEGSTLATDPGAGAPVGGVKGYIDALGACPLVQDVRLVGAQRSSAEGGESQRFTLLVALRPAPPPFVRGVTPDLAQEEPE